MIPNAHTNGQGCWKNTQLAVPAIRHSTAASGRSRRSSCATVCIALLSIKTHNLKLDWGVSPTALLGLLVMAQLMIYLAWHQLMSPL
jgi:hypothetical protein